MTCSLSVHICSTCFAAISMLLALFVVYFIRKYIKALRAGELGKNKVLLTTSTSYFILILITFLCASVVNYGACIGSHLSNTIYNTFYIIGAVSYGVSYLLVIFLLFNRLCVIFEGTCFAVCKYTKVTFYSVYVCLIVFGAITQIKGGQEGVGHEGNDGAAFGALCIIFGICLIGTLIGLYIHKLMKLHRQIGCKHNDMERNKELIATAIKAFLLTLTSNLTAMIFSCILVLRAIVGREAIADSAPQYAVFAIFYLLDIFTNFISIMFGYKSFEGYYRKICGKCDEKCISFCINKLMIIDMNTMDRAKSTSS